MQRLSISSNVLQAARRPAIAAWGGPAACLPLGEALMSGLWRFAETLPAGGVPLASAWTSFVRPRGEPNTQYPRHAGKNASFTAVAAAIMVMG